MQVLGSVADRRNQAIREVYARTPASKFIVAKKVLPKARQQGADGQRICGHEKEQAHEEVYMLVGRKDASLTDAEREWVGQAIAELMEQTRCECTRVEGQRSRREA